MTIITSTESVLADARLNYARDQAQQAALTGTKVNPNPTNADLIANDPTLQNAIDAAEDASTSTGGGGSGGGGHGGGAVQANGSSASAAPVDGATGGNVGKATPATAAAAGPVDTSAVSAAVKRVSVTA